MKVIIAGASGFVGKALVPALRAQGHEVFSLVRHFARAPDEISWDPAAGALDPARLTGADAVVNLSGENVGTSRWTAKRQEQILRSRVEATRTLVLGMAKLPRKPDVFLSASAVGFYGNRGDEILTEASGMGHGFLPEVCLAWETHAEGAARIGIRTVLLRFGVIFGPNGGALARMLPLFRLGLGGRLGSGRQWMSWIALNDVIGAILHALSDEQCAGPMNVVAPVPVTNAEFTMTLAHILRRPAMLPIPPWALRLAFGQMADEALLASARTIPERLNAAGYSFRHCTLETALRAAVTPGQV